MSELEFGSELDYSPSPEAEAEADRRRAIEQEARKKKRQWINELKQEYAHLSDEELEAELSVLNPAVNHMMDGHEPFDSIVFDLQEVFFTLLKERKQSSAE